MLNAALYDVLRLKVGEPADSPINAPMWLSASSESRTLSDSKIIEWTEKIQEILLSLARNVNRQLAMESVLTGP